MNTEHSPMAESRTFKSARNASVAFLAQSVLLILGLATRAVFVHTLSVDFVGIDVLFLSILSVLTLADAGLGVAVMYAMYRPLNEGNTERVASLVAFCRSMYRYVAATVLAAGLLVLPFLDTLANTESEIPHLQVYFLVLLSSVCGNYLLAHRLVLVEADQRLYLAKLYGLAFNATRMTLQIAALLLLESYLAYVILQASATLGTVAMVYRRAGKLYPYLKRPAPPLQPGARKELFAGVRAMVMFRIGGVVIHNTDPIIAVALLGAAVGGLFANYMLLVGGLVTLLEAVFLAVSASVGHLVASSDAEQRRRVFAELRLLAAWVYGTVTVGLLALLSDVVALWLGERYVLSPVVVAGIAVNFYLLGLTIPVLAFRQGTGLFRDTRYLLLAAAAVNLPLSLALGVAYGLAGIVFATVIARLITYVWAEPLLLYRRHLDGRVRSHYLKQAGFTLVTIGSFALVQLLSSAYSGNGVPQLLFTLFVAVSVTSIAYFAAFGRTMEGRALWRRVRSQLLRRS
jgi:O-antigen/teichoic acid export membrane protein